MEPRPRGRGRRQLASALTAADYSLQWSPDLAVGEGRTRFLISSPAVELQWSPDLAVGEGRAGGSRRARAKCFNGAPTSRSGKEKSRLCGLSMRIGASMEPRPRGRGRFYAPSVNPTAHAGFNGAPTSRSGKARPPTSEPRCLASFNGAPTSRSGKAGDQGGAPGQTVASMEPRPRGRGRTGRLARQARFPGTLQWSPDLAVGEGYSCPKASSAHGRLQWSPDLAVGEGPS